MAGNHPDPPSWRMSYESDGTQVYAINSGILSQLSHANLVAMNTEAPAGTPDYGSAVVFLFPEKRDIDGFFIRASGTTIAVSTSQDTTNGIDGTWASVGVYNGTFAAPVDPNYRDSVVSVSRLGVQGIKFSSPGGIAAIHLYGEVTAGQSLDLLLFWSAYADERIPPNSFDWGNVPRSSTDDVSFRIKNMSPSRAAHNILISMASSHDTSPSTPAQHVIAKDERFLATQTITTLAPGATSDVYTLRRITPSNAQLGNTAFRIFAIAESWS